jgi:hypothetical protein
VVAGGGVEDVAHRTRQVHLAVGLAQQDIIRLELGALDVRRPGEPGGEQDFQRRLLEP